MEEMGQMYKFPAQVVLQAPLTSDLQGSNDVLERDLVEQQVGHEPLQLHILLEELQHLQQDHHTTGDRGGTTTSPSSQPRNGSKQL